MTTARNQLICLESTAYYHCVSRCVRRSFLCGEDAYSGKSYEHRGAWVEEKIYQLAVIYLDKQEADALTPAEVAQRWRMFLR